MEIDGDIPSHESCFVSCNFPSVTRVDNQDDDDGTSLASTSVRSKASRANARRDRRKHAFKANLASSAKSPLALDAATQCEMPSHVSDLEACRKDLGRLRLQRDSARLAAVRYQAMYEDLRRTFCAHEPPGWDTPSSLGFSYSETSDSVDEDFHTDEEDVDSIMVCVRPLIALRAIGCGQMKIRGTDCALGVQMIGVFICTFDD